jgi:hypothetical protein
MKKIDLKNRIGTIKIHSFIFEKKYRNAVKNLFSDFFPITVKARLINIRETEFTYVGYSEKFEEVFLNNGDLYPSYSISVNPDFSIIFKKIN